MASVTHQALAAAAGRVETLIDRTLGTNIGDLVSNGGLAAAFDGVTNQSSASSAYKSSSSTGWIGKTLASPAIFSKAVVHGSNNSGFVSSTSSTVNIVVMGKQGSAPANFLDGTNIGSISITDTANESAGRTIVSTNTATAWDHIWIRTAAVFGSPSGIRVAELVLYELK